jgi:large subunit ribosomal protein L18
MILKRVKEKEKKLVARHRRIRKRLIGTPERPRLCVHRSLKNFSAQIIDDCSGKVLCGLSTLNKELKSQMKTGGNVDAARKLGEAFAAVAKGKGIKQVCFDRGGYLYHGRVKAFADAARKSGLDL